MYTRVYSVLLYLETMRRSFTVVILLSGFTSLLVAQGNISTDRPNQTYAATVEGKGSVIVETGVLLDRVNDIETTKTNDYGQTFIRIGTGANMEIQVATSFLSLPEADLNGLSPLKLGAKIRLAEEKGPWPAMAFIGNITLPWIGKEEFRPENVAPDFRFIFNHTLSDRFSLAYNLGMQWDGFSSRSSFLYTLLLSAGIVGDLGGYIEVFGDFPEGSGSTHAFDFGFTYLLNPNVQLDASYGLTFTDPGGHYFNFGAAFRLGAGASAAED